MAAIGTKTGTSAFPASYVGTQEAGQKPVAANTTTPASAVAHPSIGHATSDDTWAGGATRKVDTPVAANAAANSVRLRALLTVAASAGISQTTPAEIQAAAIARIADRDGDQPKLARLFVEADGLSQLQAPPAFKPKEWGSWPGSGLQSLVALAAEGLPSPIGQTPATYRDALLAVAQGDAPLKNPLLSLALSAACKELHTFNWQGAQDFVATLAASPHELKNGISWDDLQIGTRDVVYSGHGWTRDKWDDALKEPARQTLVANASLLGFDVSTPEELQTEALARIAERQGKTSELEGVFRLSGELLRKPYQYDKSAFRATILALVDEGFPSPMNHTLSSYRSELLALARSDATERNPLFVLLLRAACQATQVVDWDKDKALASTLLAAPQELKSGTTWDNLPSGTRAVYSAHDWSKVKWEAALAERFRP